ncbi:hypothetical protein SARC_00109 [Sphaeroforma arctica JP610]|uniref:Uncharacterized protein n=1 Tax=Sphaeroforma arctica JP610 TaxID=667725 RepID=A0A0L0GFP9_9EUKA|nr:hypothetical protein SARC_00109 [Sphaeroforma arctica JP610]KNC87852.1 hypothetical protein SARC_00109 [Sphaeroforma arctica JP610]|eukprot:XP_014161754.1 hypothetical protein SARC_00109 [Sphaeroforma arctica JP610]
MSAVEPLQEKIDAHRELTERNEALQQELKAATTSFTNAAMDEAVMRTLISEWTAKAGNPNEPPPKQPRDISDIRQATSVMRDLYRYRSERLYFGLVQNLREEEGAPLAQIRGTIKELEHEKSPGSGNASTRRTSGS